MSNPRSQSPHYRSNPRQHEDPSRKFPWDEPDFDPQELVARLDNRSYRRGQRSRDDPGDRWGCFEKEDGKAFRGNQRLSGPDELGHRKPPPLLFPDEQSHGERRRLSPKQPHQRHDGRVKAGRGREDFRGHGDPGGRSRDSPDWMARERLPSSLSRSREPSLGRRRDGPHRSQERPLDHSPDHRAPDRQGRGEERRDKSASHMERHREDSCRDRSPISNPHRRDMEGHVHPGYGKEEELRDRPRDGYREALGDVSALTPLVVEHGHGIANNREPQAWDMTDRGHQDVERHSRPRQMGFTPDRDRSSNNWSEPWEESRETPFQDGRREPGHESRRGLMGNNRANQPGKFSQQKGHAHFRVGPPAARGRIDVGRRGAYHDEELATSPIRNAPLSPKFPRGCQDLSQELQDFPREHADFRQGRHLFDQEHPALPSEHSDFIRGRPEIPRQGSPQFPRKGLQEFHKQGLQESPRQGSPQFPRQGHQDFPRKGLQEFPRKDSPDFPRQGHQDFPRRGHQDFPRRGHQDFPRRGHQDFPRRGHQDFPRRGQGWKPFPLGHKEFNQGRQGQAFRDQREDNSHGEPGQENPRSGKDSKPHMGRSSMSGEMSGPLDPVGPSQREHRWKNQQESSEVMVVSEETLTIKVDMNRPASKNSALCYSSDRQLSLDLVNVGRQRLDFLPMMEHSGTFRENAAISGTFAQEVITLVHQVKEQYFRGNTISLSQRFSAPQDGGPSSSTGQEEEEVVAEDRRPTLNKRFSMTMNNFPVHEPASAVQPEPPEPLRDPDDLRNNLERRRQERTEGVKITIAGGSRPLGAPGPASEPAAMFAEYGGFGEQEEAGRFPSWPERPSYKPQGARNPRFQRRGRGVWRQNVNPPGRNGHLGNRLGPPHQ
ncbi:BCLAF1 and THRAP3 family member 3-like [Gadus chalcogrammus]|uniref:BCLAF1 and THRAP3 family member 3-like n=1 Tax=Gadus chalcogrammus TaxID=1042646 RepID=UPI0024C48FCA|nr:BCLAF1 and THRAP3 family member 3-like [Gadus chalcogrammus]